MGGKCIYRYFDTCAKCNKNSLNFDKYCKTHMNFENCIYDLVDELFEYNIDVDVKSIYSLYEYIQNNNIYTKDLIFKSALTILFSKKKLSKIYEKYNIGKKQNIIDFIFELNKKTFYILKNFNKKKYILSYFLKKLIIKQDSQNLEDPFTYEPINSLSFKYKDKNNHIYAFNALELKHYLLNYGNTNPYTKEIIEDNIINKLDKFIYYNGLDLNSIKEKYKATSIIQLYTEVSQLIEKIGFYNNVQWFLKINNYTKIKKIIKSFHIISNDIPESKKYFINIIEENFDFDFCNEIIKLFKEGDKHFLLCCIFIKTLALYSNDFYDNMPSWLSDITVSYRLYQVHNFFILTNIEF
jgi:hypothetical protein